MRNYGGSRTAVAPGYGPVSRTRHREVAAPLRTERPDLSAGACLALPGRVLDRYFGRHEASAFEIATARSICERCPVQRDCLTDALIARTDGDSGLRAGLNRSQRRALRERVAAGADVAALVTRALRERGPAITPTVRYYLRSGKFRSPEPLR